MEARLACSRSPSLRPMTTIPQSKWSSADKGTDFRRHSHGDAVVGYIPDDHRVGADQHIVAYAYATQHLCTGTYVDVVANSRRTGIFVPRQADYNAVADPAVVPERGETA